MRHLTALDHALVWLALSAAVGFVGGWRARRRIARRRLNDKRLASCACARCREVA